jgi:hypothetical protein
MIIKATMHMSTAEVYVADIITAGDIDTVDSLVFKLMRASV